MASKWEKKKLAQCCEFNPSSLRTDWPHTHLQYIDISSVGKGVQSEPFKRMLRSEAPSRAQRLVASGDSLLSTVRPNRRSMLWLDSVADDVVASTGFAVLRAKPNVMASRFLYYTIFNQAFTDYLVTMEKGAAYPAVSVTDIGNAEINLPSLEEQTAIGEVLGALDDKIKTNSRMNSTLEAMASAIFQSWFVDFDPVRAKLDGVKPIGVDEATANLFPDSFQESELGHIPKGWEVRSVGDVVDCVGGGTPSTAEPKYWEGGTHHWTTPMDFSSLKAPILLRTDRKLTDAGIAKISSGLLPTGTVLLSSRAPVGYLAIASMPVAINQGFIALKCNEYASNYFMLNWCQSNMLEIESRATGTTFAEISKQNFRPIRVVLPPRSLMSAFTAKVEPLYEQITANLQQSQTLASLRDTLLPKLLSGELSVENLQS